MFPVARDAASLHCSWPKAELLLGSAGLVWLFVFSLTGWVGAPFTGRMAREACLLVLIREQASHVDGRTFIPLR